MGNPGRHYHELVRRSPQVARFDATTLWHFDAAEWGPSTASKPEKLTTSKWFPVRPRKPTSDLRVNEYKP